MRFSLSLREWIAAMVFAGTLAVLTWVFWPRTEELGNEAYNPEEARLVLLPVGNVPWGFLRNLERVLEDQHGFQVVVLPEMGLDPAWKIPSTSQYSAPSAAHAALRLMAETGRSSLFCIVVMNSDINDPDSGLRYLFSQHFQGVSVVSLARLNPANVAPVTMTLLTLPRLVDQLTRRAVKVINKAIGISIYGYGQSSDPESVMYGPVMSVEDIDRMSLNYKTDNR